MPKANSRKEDCHEGVCEVTFKPIQAARRSFQNLKALAGDLMEKVKETISGDSHSAARGESADGTESGRGAADKPAEFDPEVEEENQTSDSSNSGTQNHINRSRAGHISRHSSDILDRLAQQTGEILTSPVDTSVSEGHLKMVHVRPRPPEGQREAPRYSNPWRYDSHH